MLVGILASSLNRLYLTPEIPPERVKVGSTPNDLHSCDVIKLQRQLCFAYLVCAMHESHFDGVAVSVSREDGQTTQARQRNKYNIAEYVQDAGPESS